MDFIDEVSSLKSGIEGMAEFVLKRGKSHCLNFHDEEASKKNQFSLLTDKIVKGCGQSKYKKTGSKWTGGRTDPEE